MQAQEVRTWSTEEVEGRLQDAYKELFVLRREKVTGRLEDANRIKSVKRDIARMKTVLRERELSAYLVEGGETE
jgi:large subunit ribosomal protein L29